VLPEHRAHGTGSALFQTAEAAFNAAGCTNVSLQLANSNSARSPYRRNGYTERSGYELLDKMLD
jgi:ribosomal protein S18 acetylase RimI-like enzyme